MSAGEADDFSTILGAFFGAKPPRRLGVAVSGGGDSMALLDLAALWGIEAGVPVAAVTLDHGLRPEAAEEARAVAAFCEGRGMSHRVLRWDGKAAEGNLQAAAREARYRLIADWARAAEVDCVALAHTRDDQAETVLMRLVRQAGSDGLRGMAARYRRDGMDWVRPLLGVRRAALRTYLERRGIGWVEDPSNEDERFERVKARRVLAALEPLEIGAETLAQVAAQLRVESDALRHRLLQVVEREACERHGAVGIPDEAYRSLHPELRRRLLNAVVRWIGGATYPPRREALAAFEEGLSMGKARTLSGVVGWCRQGHLCFVREFAAVGAAVPPGEAWDGRWLVEGPWEDGMTVRATGRDGLQQWKARLPDIPQRVMLPLPSVWSRGEMIGAPHLDPGGAWTAVNVRRPFATWLAEH